MGLRQALTQAVSGFRAGLVNKITTAVPEDTGGFSSPLAADVPRKWAEALLGPGIPLTPVQTNQRSAVAEKEPRSFQYVPNVNATISPRIAYGLTPFGILKTLAENVPEVAMCIRLLTEELKTFQPRILDPDGNIAQVADLEWMITAPDGYTPWSVWLSRYLYNILAYDAGTLYKIRDDDNKVTGLRVLDGSTIFVLIDERGEQPAPPAPAFTQIIFGLPKIWMSTNQLYYMPRHIRADAPYGRTPTEDALQAVALLQNLWTYETAWYTEGTMPEQFITAPQTWTPQQIVEWERAFNDRMSGNNAERRRLRVLPFGFTLASGSKTADWKKDTYDTALERVAFSFGVPTSELGKAPGGGLGGKGFQDKQESAFYRMGIGPLKDYIENPFNSALQENGYQGYRWELYFESAEIDLNRRREQANQEWTNGLVTRDEARQYIGRKPVGGPLGAAYLMPAGKTDTPPGGPPGVTAPGANGNGANNGHTPAAPEGETPESLIEEELTATPESAIPEAGDTAKGYVPALGDDAGSGPAEGSNSYQEMGEGGLPLPAAECPYNNCRRLLEVTAAGWYKCPHCKRLLYAEAARDDYKWFETSKYQYAVRKHGRPSITATPIAKELRPWKKFLELIERIEKHCGVCPEDDAYYGSPVSREIPIYFPRQGANETEIVALSPRNMESRPGLWKPESGENEALRDYIGGPLYPREEAAYLFDRVCEFYLVPVAYKDEVDGENGAAIHYVRGNEPRKDVNEYGPVWVERAAALDFVICQVDRADHNWLTHPDDPARPILIDNGLSYPVEERPVKSAFVEAWRGRPLSQDTLNSLTTAKNDFSLWVDITECVGGAAVENAKYYIDVLLDLKKIPSAEELNNRRIAEGRTNPADYQ